MSDKLSEKEQNYAAIAGLLRQGTEFQHHLKEGRVKLVDKPTGANPEAPKTKQ